MRYDPRPADHCTGHQPGTDMLMRVTGELFGTTPNGQTFVCKQIAGSANLSYHSFGMSGDSSGYPGPMRALADALTEHAEALGIQEVIYDRKRGSCETGEWVVRDFHGSDPHTSHVHWTLNVDAAANLTEAAARAIFAGTEPPPPNTEDTDMRVWIHPADRKTNPAAVRVARLLEDGHTLRAVGAFRLQRGASGTAGRELDLGFTPASFEWVGANRDVLLLTNQDGSKACGVRFA